MDPALKANYANPEIIAVNQDADGGGRGVPGGRRVAGGNFTDGAKANVWARNLHSGDVAIIFINAGDAPTKVVCDASCIVAAGLVAGRRYSVRDVVELARHVFQHVDAVPTLRHVEGDLHQPAQRRLDVLLVQHVVQ